MRHKIGHRKLQRSAGHRTALLRNLAASLIKHEQILTGTAKAKELRPYVEKLITLAKKGGLSNRRLASSRLQDDAQLTKLFEVLAERYKDRNGGYTRLPRVGRRPGRDHRTDRPRRRCQGSGFRSGPGRRRGRFRSRLIFAGPAPRDGMLYRQAAFSLWEARPVLVMYKRAWKRGCAASP